MKNFRILILILIPLIVGCSSSREIINIHDTIYKTNTEYVNKIQYDSIYIHDSIDRYVKGDTVYVNKFKNEYVYKYLHDTINTTDTIYKINTETVIEEKYKNKISAWDVIVNIGFFLLLGLIIYSLYKKFIKK